MAAILCYTVLISDYKNYYETRKQTFQISDLYNLVNKYNVQEILGAEEGAVDIIKIKDINNENWIAKGKMSVKSLSTGNLNTNHFILFAYRNKLKCDEECLKIGQLSKLPEIEGLENFQLTPLLENHGQLPINYRTYAQNIYYPVNGSYIYLANKKITAN